MTTSHGAAPRWSPPRAATIASSPSPRARSAATTSRQSSTRQARIKNQQWLIKITGVAVYDRISGPHHRVGTALQPVADTSDVLPHGLVGQSFGSSEVPRYGRVDQYPPLEVPSEFTTAAMAEGAIEGSASDYQVASPYATGFAFSRFNAAERSRTVASSSTASTDTGSESVLKTPARCSR